MRKKVSVGIVLFLVAGMAFGAGSIISSFPSPHSNWPKGLAYHAGYLYHGSNYSYNRIYQTTTAGSIVRTITCPANTVGVEFTGTYFWTCSYSPTYIYQLTSTGSVIKSFYSPVATGITFDGTYLWGSTWGTNTVYKLTTAGSVLSSFQAPHGRGFLNKGIDWGGEHLWLAQAGYAGGYVYQMTTAGSVVYSIFMAGRRPTGVSWDGKDVWFADGVSDWVFKMRWSGDAVAPASLGKVKALFK